MLIKCMGINLYLYTSLWNQLKILPLIVRSFLGVIFIVSSILKLVSIDTFEIYVFSLGLFNLELSLVFVRVLLAFELFLGLMLLLGVYTKQTVLFSIIALLGFTVFIVSLIVNNQTEHCHCFGDKIQLNHYQSIIKNVALIPFLFLVRKTKSLFKSCQTLQALVIALASFIAIGFISPPDNFLRKTYDRQTTFHEESLNQYLNESGVNTGKHIVLFLSPECQFCDLASKKLEVILKKIETGYSCKLVFWGEEELITNFLDDHVFEVFDYNILSPVNFLRITEGKMPLILLIDNGEVIQKYGYRNLDEREIIDFFE